ncbi:hypothetical protein WAI453_009480 [Rhynchosporium graminicola]
MPRYLLSKRTNEYPTEECFEIMMLERKDQAGGIWNQTEADDKFATPMYPSCNTNVPRTMMHYTGIPYPMNTPFFPKNTVVKKYLQGYAKELEYRNLIKYNCNITAVESCYYNASGGKALGDGNLGKWPIKFNNGKTVFGECSF